MENLYVYRERQNVNQLLTSEFNLIDASKKGIIEMVTLRVDRWETEYYFKKDGVLISSFVNQNKYQFEPKTWGVQTSLTSAKVLCKLDFMIVVNLF